MVCEGKERIIHTTTHPLLHQLPSLTPSSSTTRRRYTVVAGEPVDFEKIRDEEMLERVVCGGEEVGLISTSHHLFLTLHH